MKKLFLFVFLIIMVLLVVAAFGNKPIIDPIPVLVAVSLGWEEIRKNDIAQVSPEWSVPKLLSFNTAGWQEGGYISPDWGTFYFGYIDVDAFRIQHGDGTTVKIGPSLDNKKTCLIGPTGKWNCGDTPRYDLFYVEKTVGSWSTPKPHPLTLNCPVQSLTMVGQDKAYFVASFEDNCGG